MRNYMLVGILLILGCGGTKKSDLSSSDNSVDRVSSDDAEANNPIDTEENESGANEVGNYSEGNHDVIFLSPTVISQNVRNDFELKLFFRGVPVTANWELYYSASENESDMTLIANVPSIETTSIVWNTGGVTPGTYYLYVKVINGDSSSVFRNPLPVNVLEKDLSSRLDVRVVSPNGGELIAPGTVSKIKYAVTGLADGEPLKVNIELSPDGGNSFASLVDEHDALEYSWSVDPNLEPGIEYSIKITALNKAGESFADTSNRFFAVGDESIQPPSFEEFDAIAAQSCSGSNCHGAGSALVQYVGNKALVDGNKNGLNSEISSGRMPRNSTLTDEDKDLMLRYLSL